MTARILLCAASWSALLAACGCAAPTWKRGPHDQFFQVARPPALHAPPPARRVSGWWEMGAQSGVRPAGELISPAAHLRRLSVGAAALDVNAFGQVPDSPWYENRIGKNPASAAWFRRGPDTVDGPAPGPLVVLSGKTEGATPGLVVSDSRKDRWIVKFDPPAFPEMASGAEVIATKILHAAGYHVPENHVVVFALSRLRLSHSAVTRDDYNRERPLTHAVLRNLIAQLNPRPDGTIRALFSRRIPGRGLGPFSYDGTRPGDENDRIPHGRRRSLRGLWVFAALLNHTEVSQSNTYDTFLPIRTSPDLGHVRHYLIDFGSCLGSGGVDPKSIYAGYSHYVDWRYIAARLASGGGYYPYWLPAQKSSYRSVGMFESRVFDAARWRPTIPNPAFDQATPHDTYWAASILARITPRHLRAAAGAARYSEPGAAAHVARVLAERRRKILRHAFSQVLALDRPAVRDRTTAEMKDLEAAAGLLRGRCCYPWRVRWNRTGAADRELGSGAGPAPRADLSAIVRRLRAAAGPAFDRDPFLTVRWWRRCGKRTSPPVELHLRAVCDRLLPVGLRRLAAAR